MNIPTKSLKNGFSIPVFGLGTWQMGGERKHNPDNDDEKDIQAIKKAIDLGVTHIDSAENYAEGHAETLLGKAIQGIDRSKLFLVTKVSWTNLGYDKLLHACKASIKRMNTDYLDLYLVHSPNDDIPISETMKAMDELVRDGFVKNIGVSNFTTKRMIEAQKSSQNKIVVNQVYYNLAIREPEHEGLLKYCQDNDIILEAYRPVDKGALLDNDVPILIRIAKKYEKTPAQVAINWLFSQQNVITLAKTSDLSHLEENLGSVGWQLSNEDIELLRTDFPDQTKVPEILFLK